MTPEQLEAKIDVVQDNLERLGQIPQESLDEFMADFRNMDSALHRLQTTIQALMDIGAYAAAKLAVTSPSTSRDILRHLEDAGHLADGSTDRFAPMFSFRNRVVHLYDRIDAGIVYHILTNERADLRDLLGQLLSLIEYENG